MSRVLRQDLSAPFINDEVSIGPHADIDANVQLGLRSGRRSARRGVLAIGSHARIRSGSVLYAGTRIGRHFETGHGAVVREDSILGDHVCLWNHSTIDYGCRIGHRVKIHCNAYVAQYSILEDDVFLAPGVVLANDLYPGSRHSMKVLQGPVLKKGAQIGINVTVLPGVVIGARALVGSGSVVTRSVPADAVVWGNPATLQKDRRDLRWPEGYRLLRAPAARFYKSHLAKRPVYRG